ILPGVVDDDRLFVFTQIDLFYYVSVELYPGDPVLQDRMQFQAALALIRARPGYYLQWVAESLRIAPAKLFTFNATLIAVGWVLLVLGLAWLLAYAFRRIRQGPGAPERVTPPLSFARELNILLVLGLGVAAGQCLMVAALVASQLRYYDTAGVF